MKNKKTDMRIKKIFTVIALSLGLALPLGSCVSDDSTDASEILPQLNIKGSDATKLTVYNVYMGKECDITPDITYSGNKSDLQYSWKVGSYVNDVKGQLKEVSTDSVLKYVFPEGGSYYVHLAVTDGKVGKVVEYQVNVNRIFEEGYLLTSTDADGKGNLSFIKILTPEEKAEGTKELVIEHCLSSQNTGVSEDGLVKAVSGSVTFPKDVTRILVSTKDHCYFLDPNDFSIISSIAYNDVYPGFEASEFMPDSYAPYAYDKKMKKFAHLNLSYMFPYEYKYFVGFEMDDCILSYYKNYQDKATPQTFYMDYKNSNVSIFSTYATYFGKDTWFPNPGDMLKGQTLLTAFEGYAGGSVYILSKDKENSKLTLWKNASDYSGYYIDAKDFTKETIDITADMAVPEQGTRFVSSPTYDRYFYNVGNGVYVYLPKNSFVLPNKNQAAIRFGDSEEITYMETNFDTEELYVATYDEVTQRGNFYIYDCKDVTTNNGGKVKVKETYKSCAGKITYLMYKPSIQ